MQSTLTRKNSKPKEIRFCSFCYSTTMINNEVSKLNYFWVDQVNPCSNKLHPRPCTSYWLLCISNLKNKKSLLCTRTGDKRLLILVEYCQDCWISRVANKVVGCLLCFSLSFSLLVLFLLLLFFFSFKIYRRYLEISVRYLCCNFSKISSFMAISREGLGNRRHFC